MGTLIKHNAVLKLTYEEGMPLELVEGQRYQFELNGLRIFQLYPSSLSLVHEIDERWKFVGQAQITQQTIDAERQITTGTFVVMRLFDEDFSRLSSIYEAPEGKSFYEMRETS